MNRHTQVWLGMLLLLVGGWSTPVQAGAFTGLVVFGDSLADAGNNAFIFDHVLAPPGTPAGTLRTATPIAAPTFIPTFPYASERYSNGPVWVEQLAAALGVSAQASLKGGRNFAFGGARTGPVGSTFPFSLRDQVLTFVTLTGGGAPATDLYIVAGGGNDARDAATRAASSGNPEPLIAAYASNMAAILTQLVDAGAQDILLTNVPDIGITPAVQALGPTAAAGASSVAAAMNTALEATLASLPAPLVSGVHVLDVFSLTAHVFADPAAFGFTDATSACAVTLACIAAPAGTLFWDGSHPTTAGHALLAQVALAEIAIPEPATWLLLATGVTGLLGYGCRRRPRVA